MKKTYSIFLFGALLFVSLSGCLKKDFDVPPDGSTLDPGLPVTMSIAELRQLYADNGYKALDIPGDETIYGVVTANDWSGNFYKQIIIQDSTGGIAINLNKTGLHGDYPIGRKVYVKLRDLSLGEYGDFLQVGLGKPPDGTVNDIPLILINDYIIKANLVGEPQPIPMTVEELNTISLPQNEKRVGMLIKIDRAQFKSSEFGLTYALSPDFGSGTDRKIEDCSNKEIILRTSNYASFQAALIPEGSGELTAIYSRFGLKAQLILRDLNDVKFNLDRCPFGTGADSLMRIGDLRNLYQGTALTINNRKIRGTVISDPDDIFGNNITSRNMVLQDGDRGIVVRFLNSTDNIWALGDSLEIIISGQSLSEFGNLLQIGDQLIAAKVQKLGTGNVTPRTTTIADIIANFEAWESTLVRIPNATFMSASSGSQTYQGTVLLNDNSTSTDFPMFTQTYAEFANVPAPIGQTKTVTGFLYSISSANRISMRRLTDVQ